MGMTLRELTTRWLFKTDVKPITVLDNAVKGLKTRIKDLDAAIRSKFASLTKYVAAGIAGFAVAAVKMSSDAAESESKFDAVFKDMAASTREWSTALAKDIGRSKYELNKFASGLQDTFVPMGLGREAAAELSKSLTELAIDVSSFSNVAEEEVIASFTSAMVGNTEAVRRFGIVITQERIDEKIKQMSKSVSGFSALSKQQQKTAAIYNMIMDSTSDAQGDAKRTAGGFANQMRALKSRVSELTIEIGNKLLPHANKLVGKMIAWVNANEGLIKQKAEVLIEKLGKALEMVGKVLEFVINNSRSFGIALGVLVSGRILFGLGSMVKSVWGLYSAFKSVTGIAGPATTALNTFGGLGKAVASDIGGLGKGLLSIVKSGPSVTAAFGSVGGALGSLGGVVAAFGVGWQLGTWLDEATGASDALSDALLRVEKAARAAKGEAYVKDTSKKTLADQAQMYSDMIRRGQKTITDDRGMKHVLNEKNIKTRLAAVADRIGVSKEDQASMLPEIMKKAGITNQTNNITATVTVPPGTPETMARRTADAVNAELPKIMRRALPAVR